MFLRQSTAQTIRFGPFLDSTDGVTEETALTIAQADRRLSKDGGAYAQSSTTGNATHDEQGNYSTTLSTTDTNTVGELKLYVSVAGALPVWEKWYVVEEAVYDAMYAASAAGPLQSTTAGRTLDVNASGEAGLDLDNTSGTLQAAQFADNFLTAAKIASNAITAAKIASNAITNAKIAAGAITSTEATTIGTAEIVGPGGISPLSFQANSITAGAIAAAALNGKGDWNIGKTGYSISGTKTTLDALNDLDAAAVNAQVDTALSDIHLDHLLAVATTSFPGNAGSILGELLERVTTWRYVTEALSQAPSGGGGLTQQQVRDAMKLAASAGAPATDSIDDKLDEIEADTTGLNGAAMRGTDGASTHTAANVRTEMDSNSTRLAAIEADTQNIQSRLPTSLSGGKMNSDMTAISGSVEAADKLEAHALETLPVTFSGGSTTTAVLDQVDSGTAASVNDTYKGRLLIFNSGTLDHQVAEILSYDGATKTATISAVTVAVTASHTARMI